MKKLFVALMAVLVLASCGEKNEVKTPADIVMLSAGVMDAAAAKIEKATTADEIIETMSAMNRDMKNLDEKYADIIESIDEDEFAQMYPVEMDSLQAVASRLVLGLVEKVQTIEFTPEQEQELSSVFDDIDM